MPALIRWTCLVALLGTAARAGASDPANDDVRRGVGWLTNEILNQCDLHAESEATVAFPGPRRENVKSVIRLVRSGRSAFLSSRVTTSSRIDRRGERMPDTVVATETLVLPGKPVISTYLKKGPDGDQVDKVIHSPELSNLDALGRVANLSDLALFYTDYRPIDTSLLGFVSRSEARTVERANDTTCVKYALPYADITVCVRRVSGILVPVKYSCDQRAGHQLYAGGRALREVEHDNELGKVDGGLQQRLVEFTLDYVADHHYVMRPSVIRSTIVVKSHDKDYRRSQTMRISELSPVRDEATVAGMMKTIPNGTQVFIEGEKAGHIRYAWQDGEVVKWADRTGADVASGARFETGGVGRRGVLLLAFCLLAAVVTILLRYRKRPES